MELAPILLLNIAILSLMTFMVKKLGVLIHDEKTSRQTRRYLELLVWLMACFGLVIVLGTIAVVYRAIVG